MQTFVCKNAKTLFENEMAQNRNPLNTDAFHADFFYLMQ